MPMLCANHVLHAVLAGDSSDMYLGLGHQHWQIWRCSAWWLGKWHAVLCTTHHPVLGLKINPILQSAGFRICQSQNRQKSNTKRFFTILNGEACLKIFRCMSLHPWYLSPGLLLCSPDLSTLKIDNHETAKTKAFDWGCAIHKGFGSLGFIL